MNPALRAADRFRGRKFLHGYARGKVAWDPAYPAVEECLRGSTFPVLDIGCGMGLLAAYLREAGCRQPITGIEPDEKKVRLARECVASAYAGLEFRAGDARLLPEFCGDIVMLDVLHYLSPPEQTATLEQIASRLRPGGLALIRSTFRDNSWRYCATLAEEVFVRMSGWIRGGRCRFPTREEVSGPFLALRWEVAVTPMWGRTPFNSHLVEIRRPSTE